VDAKPLGCAYPEDARIIAELHEETKSYADLVRKEDAIVAVHALRWLCSFPVQSPSQRGLVWFGTEILLHREIAAGKLYGLAMVELSEGRLKRGTVYVTLNRMEEKGYLESEQESEPPVTGGLPRAFIGRRGMDNEC
jgi:hypothetical protein